MVYMVYVRFFEKISFFLQKVLDKLYGMWYNNKALTKSCHNLSFFEKNLKKIKKFSKNLLTNSKICDILIKSPVKGDKLLEN